MREVFFRGKPKNKEHSYFFSEIWKEHYEKGFVYGSLIVDKDRCFIAVSAQCNIKHCVNNGLVSMIEVDPETVGQYTGLTVPSGNIFEHDIVTAKFKSNGARFNFTVKYSNENGCYVFDNGCVKVPFNDIRSVRKIGNIHDNPELLKGGVDNG